MLQRSDMSKEYDINFHIASVKLSENAPSNPGYFSKPSTHGYSITRLCPAPILAHRNYRVARMPKLSSLLIPVILLLTSLRAVAAPPEFNRDVPPILADNCLGCHRSDKHQSGLRLDHREVATRPAKSGETAITPGHPESSELVRRITS